MAFIEYLLNKLTYRIKLVTAVIFYTCAVILFTFLQQSWEEQVISRIETKIQGLDYESNLNLFLISALRNNDDTYALAPLSLSFEFLLSELKKHLHRNEGSEAELAKIFNSIEIPSKNFLSSRPFIDFLWQLDALIKEEFDLDYSLDTQEYLFSTLINDRLTNLENSLLQLVYFSSQPSEKVHATEAFAHYYILKDFKELLNLWAASIKDLDLELKDPFWDSLGLLIQKIDSLSIEEKDQSVVLKKILEEVVQFRVIASQTLKEYLQTQISTLNYWRNLTKGVFRLALAIIIVIYVVRMVRKPLDHLQHAAEQVSNWNLAVRIPIFAKDELSMVARQFNGMLDYFEKILLEARSTITNLTRSSQSIHESTRKLETSIVRQEKEIKKIAEGSQNITTTLAHLANFFQDVRQSSSQTFQVAETGYAHLFDMQTAMKQIILTSNEIFNSLVSLETQIPRIHQIILSLVNVADQSNLLSLNTSIRAGKTGAGGAGFSVIATKISELANQTASAVIAMELLVKKIVDSVSTIIRKVEQFNLKINAHVHDEKILETNLRQMIAHTQQQIQSFESLYQAIVQQTDRAQLILTSLPPIIRGAHQSVDSVRDLYHQIDYLNHVANRLQSLIGRFSLSADVSTVKQNED